MRKASHPVDERRRREDLAAPEQPLEIREIARLHHVKPRHVIEDRGDGEPLGQPLVPDELGELVRQEADLLRHQVQARSRGEAPEDVEHREVEVQRRMPGQPVGSLEAEVLPRPLHEPDHALVGDDDTLGGPRGARGEEDVGRCLARAARLERRRRAVFDAGPIQPHLEGDPGRRPDVHPADGDSIPARGLTERLLEQTIHRPRGQDPPWGARRQDRPETSRRAGRVERNVEGVGLVDPDEAGDRRRRLGHQDPDPVALRAAARSHGPGDPVRQRLELRVGQDAARAGDGDGGRALPRPAGHPVLESLGHAMTSRARSKATRVCSRSSGSLGTSRMKARYPAARYCASSPATTP